MPNNLEVPDRRSWGSLRPSTYSMSTYGDDGNVSPRTSRPHRTTQSHAPVSAISTTHRNARHRDSPVSAIDFARTEEARKGSDATVWPIQEYVIKKPAPVVKHKQGKQEDTWKIGDFYRNARGIYHTGPKGEGQKLWKSYKVTEQAKKGKREVEATAKRRPSAGLAAHPPSGTTLLEMKAIAARGKAAVAASNAFWTKAVEGKGKGPAASTDVRKESDVSRSSKEVPIAHVPSNWTSSKGKGKAPVATPEVPIAHQLSSKTSAWTPSKGEGKAPISISEPRKPSEVSCSSLEVPFGIHPDIQRYVDTSKALPRVPKLQPAPRQRGYAVSKDLPPVPQQLHEPPKPKDRLRAETYTKSLRPTRLDAYEKPSGPAREAYTKPIVPSRPAVPSTYVPPRRGWTSSRTSDKPSPKSTTREPSKPKPSEPTRPAVPSTYVPPRCGWIPSIDSHEISPKSSTVPTTSAHQWWKTPLVPTSQDKAKPTRNHPADTKPTISRPRQISDLSTTANLPAAMGGIGGPSTLRAPPHHNQQQGSSTKNKARKDSDASFGCAGERASWEAVPTSFSGPRGTREERETRGESVLFTWERRERREKEKEKQIKRKGGRDTRFYQPYVEVLQEYDDGRY